MASFSAGTTFTDGVANDVTAAKLGALVNNATPTSGFIQDRTAETITATNDTLLIGDASDSNNLKRITVANFAQTLPTAKITTGTVVTGTFGTTTSTAATITTGTIPILTAGTTTGTAATFSGDLTIADKIVHSGDTNTAIRFPAADTVTVETSGTERLRVTSSGGVGIGTSTPLASLHVVRAASGTILATGGSSDYTAIQIVNTSGVETQLSANGNSAGEIRTTTNHPLLLYTNNTERLRVDSSGNVGIGTTNPTKKLQVVGPSANGAGNEAFWVDANSVQFAVRRDSGGGGTVEIGSPNIHNLGLFTNGTTKVFIEAGGNIGIGTTSPTYKLDVIGDVLSNSSYRLTNGTVSANFQLNGTSSPIINVTSGHGLEFRTNNTERLRIDSDGDVSIGTATALSKLHVHGNVTLSNTTTATSAGTGGLSKPATYAGYLTVSINGTSRKIPYYAT